jgi:predicted nucleic acid-binding protein
MALVYLDTTALVRLCRSETGTALAVALWEGADVVATARIADAEVRAAFATAFREGALTGAEARAGLEEWDRLWPALAVVEPSRPVLDEAASLVVRHPLRAADALHVASAMSLRSPDLLVGCYDESVAAAARAENLRVVP